MLCEYIHVAFERETYVDCLFVSEQLGEDLVKDLTVRQRNQVNQKGVLLIAQLQQCRTHHVKLGHLRAPLTIHANHVLSEKCFQHMTVLLFPYKRYLDV